MRNGTREVVSVALLAAGGRSVRIRRTSASLLVSLEGAVGEGRRNGVWMVVGEIAAAPECVVASQPTEFTELTTG